MTNAEILEKAIARPCLGCGIPLGKNPKESYKQYFKKRYCSLSCSNSQPRKKVSDAKEISALHKFWRSRIPMPKHCEVCREERRVVLSNRSQQYLNVITDWWWLCDSCHSRYDGIQIKLWDKRKQAL